MKRRELAVTIFLVLLAAVVIALVASSGRDIGMAILGYALGAMNATVHARRAFER